MTGSEAVIALRAAAVTEIASSNDRFGKLLREVRVRSTRGIDKQPTGLRTKDTSLDYKVKAALQSYAISTLIYKQNY